MALGKLFYEDEQGKLQPLAQLDPAFIARVKSILGSSGGGDQGPPPDPNPDPDDTLPEPSGIIVSPGDNLQEAVNDAKNGENLNLRGGVYQDQRIYLTKPLNIQGYKGQQWTLDGRRRLDVRLTVNSAGVLVGRFPKTGLPFIWCGRHPGTPAGHADLMRPEIVTYGDDPLLWKQSVGSLTPGTFHIAGGTAAESTIYIRPKSNAPDLANFYYSPHHYLISGDDNVVGVRIADGILQYASTTCHTGMLECRFDEMIAENMALYYANTIGVKLGDSQNKPVCGLVAKGVKSERHGQQGWWGAVCNSVLEDCTNSFNNWKGFAPNWEAGCKFERSSGSRWINWYCEGNLGPSFWFDIQNNRNFVDGVEIKDGLKVGAMFEHYFAENDIRNISVDGISKWRGQADGVVIQSNVKNNTFTGFDIKNVEKGLRYKKQEDNDRDKGSGFNEFEAWVFDQIEQQKVYIEGNESVFPDVWKFPRI